MNILRDLTLSRRTVLRGVGATMALPFLEIMLTDRAVAAAAAGKKGVTATGIPKRLGVFYLGTGMNMREFEPGSEGKDYKIVTDS